METAEVDLLLLKICHIIKAVSSQTNCLIYGGSSTVTFSGCFSLLASKFWEGGGDKQMIFCQSVSVVRVVSIVVGGGDIHNLTNTVESMLTFFARRQ